MNPEVRAASTPVDNVCPCGRVLAQADWKRTDETGRVLCARCFCQSGGKRRSDPCPDCGARVAEPTEPGMVHGCPCSRVAWFYGDPEPGVVPR